MHLSIISDLRKDMNGLQTLRTGSKRKIGDGQTAEPVPEGLLFHPTVFADRATARSPAIIPSWLGKNNVHNVSDSYADGEGVTYLQRWVELQNPVEVSCLPGRGTVTVDKIVMIAKVDTSGGGVEKIGEGFRFVFENTMLYASVHTMSTVTHGSYCARSFRAVQLPSVTCVSFESLFSGSDKPGGLAMVEHPAMDEDADYKEWLDFFQTIGGLFWETLVETGIKKGPTKACVEGVLVSEDQRIERARAKRSKSLDEWRLLKKTEDISE